MKVMAVRDIKADAWHNPMFVQSIGGCIRAFADEINSKEDNPFSKHPEDYEIWELGEWDEQTNKWTFLEKPKSHGVGTTYRIAK